MAVTCKFSRDGLTILVMLLAMDRMHIFCMLFVAKSPLLGVALGLPFCDGTPCVVTLKNLELVVLKLFSRGARDWRS